MEELSEWQREILCPMSPMSKLSVFFKAMLIAPCASQRDRERETEGFIDRTKGYLVIIFKLMRYNIISCMRSYATQLDSIFRHQNHHHDESAA